MLVLEGQCIGDHHHQEYGRRPSRVVPPALYQAPPSVAPAAQHPPLARRARRCRASALGALQVTGCGRQGGRRRRRKGPAGGHQRGPAAGGRRGGPRAGQACARAGGRGAGTSGSSGRDGVKSGRPPSGGASQSGGPRAAACHPAPGMTELWRTSLADVVGKSLQAQSHDLPPQIKLVSMLGTYLRQHYHGRFDAKAQNLRPGLRASYDAVLHHVGVLAMPTTPMKAQAYRPQRGIQEPLRMAGTCWAILCLLI